MDLTPDSGSLPYGDDAADTFEEHLREVGWTDEARAAAQASRLRNLAAGLRMSAGKGRYTQHIGDMIRDRAIAQVVATYGAQAGKQVRSNLSLRVGVSTKTAPSIRSTFFSNDGKSFYTGHVRGMRQKILKWAKDNNKKLPAAFENRGPSAITGMFRGMARGGYFNPKNRVMRGPETARRTRRGGRTINPLANYTKKDFWLSP